MRCDIHRWIKQCVYYHLTFRWRSKGQEIMFSWHISSPFTIIHVDLWMPGKYTNHDDIVQPKQDVSLTHWEFLLSFCNQFSIVPSTLST